MDLFSHSWLPFMYQYGFGLLIFGGGLFAVFKAYGGKKFWKQYKIILIRRHNKAFNETLNLFRINLNNYLF